MSLHQASPCNFVRLVLGEERSSDTGESNRFSRAGGFLRDWLAQGILQREAAPALYRQRISFQVDGVRKELSTLTALVRLHPYEDEVILPHEKTLKGPKEDLARLMASTQANLDCVWFLYEDNAGTVGKALSQVRWQSAVQSASMDADVCYGLDACTDAKAIAEVSAALEPETLVIADGHHRYETSLAYAQNQDRAHPDAAARPWRWVMASLTWVDEPGLTVLPTHRVVRDLPAEVVAAVPGLLEGRFQLSPVSPDRLADALHDCPDPCFAAFDGAKAWIARPRNPVDAIGAELLQQCVLAEGLGFDVAHLKTDPRIAYVERIGDAVEMVRGGGAQAAYLLKPIPVRTITRYAVERRAMPQKSTYFYPKLASGLVLRLMDAEPHLDP